MKTLKCIWKQLLVFAVSVAMMIGCFGGVVLAEPEGPSPVTSGSLHVSGGIPTKVALNDEFSIPKEIGGAKVTVKSPEGRTATSASSNDTSYTYKATDLGNYTVKYYYENGVSYSYYINCYEEDDYFVYVANEADIPTYVGVGDDGKEFTLPKWYLATTDDDDENKIVDAKAGFTKVELDGAEIEADKDGNYIVKFNKGEVGTHTLVLSAGLNEKKLYKEQYTIIAQKTFNDTKAPILRNIANMPSSASLNTKVDLPQASAEDDYDERVLITVTVNDPEGNPVTEVASVNDQGYAETGDSETDKKVEFDNNRVRSFYPTMVGTYVVTYKAKDDAGNESSAHTYKITVSDKTGPIITDIEDSKIPSVWGLNSVQGSDEEYLADSAVYLPIPKVVDNNGEFTITKKDDGTFEGKGDLKLTVEIRNPNVTVARFDRITASDVASLKKEVDASDTQYGRYFKDDVKEGEEVTSDYGVKIVDKDGAPAIKLNFGDFYASDTTDLKTKAGIVGDWTVTYSFRDADNNGGYNASQKVYTINVKELTFIDDTAPEITAPSLPDYLIIGGEETSYTVPSIEVSDDNDARLTQEYSLKCGENTLKVEGGEELEIVEAEGVYSLKNENGDTLTLSAEEGAKLEFVFTALDDANNSAKLVMPKDDEEAADENYSVSLYYADKAGFESANVTFDIIDTEDEAKHLVAGDTMQSVGGFTVDKIAQPEFVGFEISVTDEDGNEIDNVSAYMFFATKTEDDIVTESLNVRDISFKPARTGKYQLSIRVFDAKGNNYTYAKFIYATKDDELNVVNGKNAATAWQNNGIVGNSYSLKREEFVAKGENVSVYNIKGGKFEMLGFNFTPLAQGNYTITEYYGVQSEFDNEGFKADKLTSNAKYGITVTDSHSVDYEILGILPTYTEKLETAENRNIFDEKSFYVTPAIIAYAGNVNYDVEVTYTTPSGNSNVKANKVYEKADAEGNTTFSFKKEDGDFFGRFALALNEDGAYTVTVKAVGTNDSGKSYTIKVGDVISPQFTIDTSDESRRVGDKFSYREFTYVPDADHPEEDSSITVSYKLIEPGSSGTEVTSVSESGRTLSSLKGSSTSNVINLDEKIGDYTFSKSGDYTVEITFKDAAGNKTVQKYTISVSTTTASTPTSLTMLSTVLIIVGVLLILGVLVYLIRFRKRRE